MSRPTEILYGTPFGVQRVKPLELLIGEARRVSIDYSSYLAYKGAPTITSSVWASEGTMVSPSSTTNTAGVVSALLTPGTATGLDSIKNTATLSNGEKLVRKFRVCVKDPMMDEITDYGFAH